MFVFSKDIVHPDDKVILSQLGVMQQYYNLKYRLAKFVKPKVIAEIGVRAGYSGWAFLQAAPEAKYYGLDANNGSHGGKGINEHDWWSHAKDILHEYNTVLTEVDTQKVNTLTSIIKDLVDLFHVDGDHTKEGVKHDLDLAAKVLSPTGAILVDDIHYIKPVRLGVDEWLDKHKEFKGQYVHSLRGETLIQREEYFNRFN